MNRRATRYIITGRWEKVQHTFSRVKAGFGMEDIHAFRLEIKKMRAFLRLDARTKDHARLPGRLHRFYFLAGVIRNLQLQQQRITEAWKGREESLPRLYLIMLETEIGIKTAEARSFAKDKLSIKKEREKVLAKVRRSLSGKAIRGFVQTSAGRLDDLWGWPYPLEDDTLHSIRKLLKDLFYNHAYIAKEASILLPAALREKTGIKNITDMLGGFQDMRMKLDLLQPEYLSTVNDERERMALEELKKKWEEEKANGKESIIQKLGSLYISDAGQMRITPEDQAPGEFRR
jgi:CHAD domain-containing protein